MLKELRAEKILSIGLLLGATVSVILSYNAIASLANIMDILHMDNPAGISFSICIGVLILGTLLQMLAGIIVLVYGKEKISACRFLGCAVLFVNGISLILEIRSGSAGSLVAATFFMCNILLPILYLIEITRCQ